VETQQIVLQFILQTYAGWLAPALFGSQILSASGGLTAWVNCQHPNKIDLGIHKQVVTSGYQPQSG